MPEGPCDIGDRRLHERIDRRALRIERGGQARWLGEGRGELSLEFTAQLPLKIGIALKAELGDEAQDGRGADLGALGEFGDRRQPGGGIVGEQRVRRLALSRRQPIDRIANVFGDRRAIVEVRPALFIPARLRPLPDAQYRSAGGPKVVMQISLLTQVDFCN